MELAAEKDATLTVDEVQGFLTQVDEDEEFDDIEPDVIALSANAAGRSLRSCCQAEAYD